MKNPNDRQSQQQHSHKSSGTENGQNCSNISQDRYTGCQSIHIGQKKGKNWNTASIRFFNNDHTEKSNTDDSFFSESDQIKFDDNFNDEFILQKKVQKKDIIFKTKHFKQTFVKHFVEVFIGFFRQPSDLSFIIALDRLKYYCEQSPFLNRNSKTQSDNTQRQNSSFNSNDSQMQKSCYSNSKTISSADDLKQKLDLSYEQITVQNLLKSMLYQNQYQFMIYTFDYIFCHLTFLAAMLYFWTKIDQPFQEQVHFVRTGQVQIRQQTQLSYQSIQNKGNKKQKQYKTNIFKTLKFYVHERSQSLNICQASIMISYFFLNYIKHCNFFQFKSKQINGIQQNLINDLKLFRRIKKLQAEFNKTSNQVIFQSQLHKYQCENKLIENIEKTFQLIQFLNTHNFVSTPLQKYYQLHQFSQSRKYYHLKRDYFCIWVMNIILRLCEKKSAQSLSKSAYYIITFLALLKKFKENRNFQGISLILPILYNIKEQLPKVWGHAQNRRKQINERLKEYSQILAEKRYKKEEIPKNCNAIISQDVIYEMCTKFQKYSKIDKNDIQNSGFVPVEKHKKFYNQFLIHIIYHRNQIMEQYSDEIEYYKRQKEIGISINMYLLDTYIWRSFRGTNAKALWGKLVEKSKQTNQQINCSLYIDIIDYCFVGSSLKYKQLDI